MNCRFIYAGQTRYGQDEPYSEEAKKYAAQGKLVVSDGVTGTLFAIDKKDVTEIPFKFPEFDQDKDIMWNGSECDDFVAFVAVAHDLQEARVREALKGKKKVMPGHQFRIGVADGYACYVITKVRGKKALVEWRAFCADHYYDHHFGFGGMFPVTDLARYIHFGAPIFGKPMTVDNLKDKVISLAEDFQRRFGTNPIPLLMNYLLPA